MYTFCQRENTIYHQSTHRTQSVLSCTPCNCANRLACCAVLQAATRQRLDSWLDGVVADMQADGLLPNHKVYLWIRRPLRAKPTKMQKLQHALATPWHWIKEHTMPGKVKRRQAACRSRMAALKPIY